MKQLQEIRVPKDNVNDEFVTITELSFETGDRVRAGDVVIEIETSKAVMSLSAEVDGDIVYLCAEEDDVPVGHPIVRIYDLYEHVAEPQESVATVPQTPSAGTLFSESAQAWIAAHRIDPGLFEGHDFVTLDDVKQMHAPEPPDLATQADTQALIDTKRASVEKLTKSKRTEIAYLRAVQQAGLNSCVNVYVEVAGVLDFIAGHFSLFDRSLLPLVVYESARLLKTFRELNAYFADDQIVFYRDVHIGLAVDIDDGLKVVKIPNADTLDLKQLEREMTSKIDKYLARALTVDDLSGTTFSITDLSVQDVSFFTPLINRQQSAVLGISAVDPKLQRSVLTLTFDHRVLAGKQATEFLVALKQRLESYHGAESPNDGDLAHAAHLRCAICQRDAREDRDLNGLGFVRLIDHAGAEKLVCTFCLTHG